jgi:hypothetical protein
LGGPDNGSTIGKSLGHFVATLGVFQKTFDSFFVAEIELLWNGNGDLVAAIFGDPC